MGRHLGFSISKNPGFTAGVKTCLIWASNILFRYVIKVTNGPNLLERLVYSLKKLPVVSCLILASNGAR